MSSQLLSLRDAWGAILVGFRIPGAASRDFLSVVTPTPVPSEGLGTAQPAGRGRIQRQGTAGWLCSPLLPEEGSNPAPAGRGEEKSWRGLCHKSGILRWFSVEKWKSSTGTKRWFREEVENRPWCGELVRHRKILALDATGPWKGLGSRPVPEEIVKLP